MIFKSKQQSQSNDNRLVLNFSNYYTFCFFNKNSIKMIKSYKKFTSLFVALNIKYVRGI